MEYDTKGKVLKKNVMWQNLYFYRKSDVLYQLTVEFCHRFLPPHGDRTVDQMIQAARSGKQNIVEGSEDGQTSSEMEIKLINVARSSLKELLLDYHDYLNTHHIPHWTKDNPRLSPLRKFCSTHFDFSDYAPLIDKMTDVEMANMAITLCHQTDRLMCAYLQRLERIFVEQGGIKERMYAARTGYRKTQDAHLQALEDENRQLKTQIATLKKRIKELEDEIKKNKEA